MLLALEYQFLRQSVNCQSWRATCYFVVAFAVQMLAAPSVGAESDRIVSAGGSVTEILYALEVEEKVVGVDTTSLCPATALKDKPNIGYVRALSAEGIMALKPSLVLAIEGAGPPDTIRLLSEAQVNIIRIPDEQNSNGVLRKIEAVGKAVSKTEKAAALVVSVSQRFAELEEARKSIDKPVRVLFVLSLQNGRAMVGGRNSAADSILKLAGATNVGTAIEGYKPMTDEAIIASAPDVILMMSRGDHAMSPSDVFALPAFAATPAASNKALLSMDGNYMLGFGPRTPDAVRELMKAFYPSLKLVQLSASQKKP